jgi:membrane-bound lytic murein transglycosylase
LVTCFYRRLSHAVAIACAAGFALTAEPATAEVTYKVLSFDDLKGWAEDDYSADLTVFQNTCRDMDDPDWTALYAYATAQPDARTFFALLFDSPSYVFFRNVDQVPAHEVPLGVMNRSIIQMCSVAVYPTFVKLGSPVWLEKDGKNPIRHLMTAQDTGSVIKGAQRADVFVGTGDEAGHFRDPGRMMVLMPIQRAYALLSEDT